MKNTQIYYWILIQCKYNLNILYFFRISLVKETLTQLVLSSNNISVIPPEMCYCSHLQYIDLGKNSLNDLPIELGDLKHIRELVISNNK